MNDHFETWLQKHHREAALRYEELSRLDDIEYAKGGSTEHYEKAHQMYGYVAALQKCLDEIAASKRAAKPRRRKTR